MRNPDKYPVLVSGSFSFLVIPYHLYKKRGGWGGIDRSLFLFFADCDTVEFRHEKCIWDF